MNRPEEKADKKAEVSPARTDWNAVPSAEKSPPPRAFYFATPCFASTAPPPVASVLEQPRPAQRGRGRHSARERLLPADRGHRHTAGAAQSDCTIDVSEPFTMDFAVYLGNNNGGADGIAWVLQQIGPQAENPSDGGGIGMMPIRPTSIRPSSSSSTPTRTAGLGTPATTIWRTRQDGSGDHTGANCIAGCTPPTPSRPVPPPPTSKTDKTTTSTSSGTPWPRS